MPTTSVNITELRSRLRTYLSRVRCGEGILIPDRNLPLPKSFRFPRPRTSMRNSWRWRRRGWCDCRKRTWISNRSLLFPRRTSPCISRERLSRRNVKKIDAFWDASALVPTSRRSPSEFRINPGSWPAPRLPHPIPHLSAGGSSATGPAAASPGRGSPPPGPADRPPALSASPPGWD